MCYYVWHSEDTENTCGVCKSSDGKIFNCEEDVPERPHPNCRCTVETVEKDDTKPQENRIPPQVPTPQPTPQPTPVSTPQPTPAPKPQTQQKWILPVSKGTKVIQGQIIALSGSTGVGTAAHLHFGVKRNGVSDNPKKYLPNF